MGRTTDERLSERKVFAEPKADKPANKEDRDSKPIERSPYGGKPGISRNGHRLPISER